MEVSRSSAPRPVESAPPARNTQTEKDRAQVQAASEEALARKRQQEQPKPVPNGLGQTTSRVLHAIA